MSETLRSLFVDNPMLEEAGRARRRFFRTGDSPRVVNYVAAGLIALFYIWVIVMIVRIHEEMVDFLLTVELLAVTGVVIASVYGAIAAERERATWDALVITRLTPAQILVGKTVWRLTIAAAIVALMALPVGISASFHRSWGVREMSLPVDLAMAHVIVLAWALLVGAFTLFVSSASRRSVTAMATATGLLLGALLLVPMLMSMFGFQMDYARPQEVLDLPCWLWLHLNPFFLLATYDQQILLYVGSRDPSNVNLANPYIVSHWREFVPLAYLAGAALFFWGALRNLRRIQEPRRRSDI